MNNRKFFVLLLLVNIDVNSLHSTVQCLSSLPSSSSTPTAAPASMPLSSIIHQVNEDDDDNISSQQQQYKSGDVLISQYQLTHLTHQISPPTLLLQYIQHHGNHSLFSSCSRTWVFELTVSLFHCVYNYVLFHQLSINLHSLCL